jgi:transcriptional regulator GlxA family with amidase domain
VLLDLVGPLQVFTHARKTPQSGHAYSAHIASLHGGRIDTNTVVQIDSDPLSAWLGSDPRPDIHTLVIVGGDGAYEAACDPLLISRIRTLAQRSHRVCSVCSGALVLAAAGLLDDRRAVTHWEDCDQLARMFPSVKVEVDPIYIKDDPIWTSAGISAGIDMALAIIQEDLGKPAAISMARSLVVPMVRYGGQSQYSAELAKQARDHDGRFRSLHNWLASNLHRKITVDMMAETCGMSPRNFSRRYSETMGVSPAKAIEAIRVDAARNLLATSDHSIKRIAVTCGFQDDERMRRAFLRNINTSPSQYRMQFQLTQA